MQNNAIIDLVNSKAFETEDFELPDHKGTLVQIADLVWRDEIQMQLDAMNLDWAWSDNTYITTIRVLVPDDKLIDKVKNAIWSTQPISEVVRAFKKVNHAEQGLVVGRSGIQYVLTADDSNYIYHARKRGDGFERMGNLLVEGDVVAAIVVKVCDVETGLVNLQCLLDGDDSVWVTSRLYSSTAERGTWHYI